MIEAETRNFAFDAIAAQNAVEGNFRAADAVVDNLASYLDTARDISSERVGEFTRSALNDNDYITGVASARVADSGAIQFDVSIGDLQLPQLTAAIELAGGMGRFVDDLGVDNAVVPVVAASDSIEKRALFLVKWLPSQGSPPVRNFAVVRINLAALVSSIAVDPSLNLAIFTESEGIAGRRLVFERLARRADDSFVVEDLVEDSNIRLDGFSLRVTASKRVFWNELERELVFVAGFLGLGVTLLLIALARAKDMQAQELEARNRVIEEQVTQQTHDLAEARDAALDASRVKSDFLASMSHEIRTPLNAIIGMADLLSESKLDDEQQNYVSVFRNSGEALLSLVNDILDMSKIEAEQLTLEKIEFDLSEIVEQGAEIYALKADAKNLELVTEIEQDVPRIVVGDPGRLRQIILNLIGNSIKFTDSGQIVISVTRSKDNQIHFEVADSGIGIPAEKLDAIFADFTQVDSSISRKYGGTGLGLAICKKLVELMNGRIWVESIEGHGSRFQFEVDLPRAMQDEEQVTQTLLNQNVLISAGNGRLLESLKKLVTARGAQTTTTHDLASCAQMVTDARLDGRSFDIVVVDGSGSVNDAAEFVSELRSSGDFTPVVALFRPSMLAAGVEQFRGLDATSYAVKPVRSEQFAESIELARMARSVTINSVTQSAVQEVSADKRILLVEDNPDNRLLVKAYLKKEPYVIQEAENGAEAVEMFKAENFELVLMDVQMPVMDGYSATRAIRDWERGQSREPAQIIALTANAVAEDVQESRNAGCDHHLTKPIKKQVLVEELRARLASC